MVAHPIENTLLLGARLRRKSEKTPGACMTRDELAEAVNAYIHARDPRMNPLNFRSIAYYEQGRTRWPGELIREAMRAVLEVGSDAELGFRQRRRSAVMLLALVKPESGVRLDMLIVAGEAVVMTDRRRIR